MSEDAADIGVIGGSGLYALEGLEDARHVAVDTPWGEPSSEVVLGRLGGRRVAFIARHSRGHTLLPGELPSHANIYALKQLGVTHVLAVSAVGSLQERYRPLDAVLPDQLIDRTHGRRSSFFGEGAVAHVSFADPFCAATSALVAEAVHAQDVTAHEGGTLVVIEGPAFSTRAESQLYRAWGGAIIGMTALPEAKLAREAELCYASLCLVTDYDVWHESEADVSSDLVLANLQQNADHARAALAAAIARIDPARDCDCRHALDGALITDPALIPSGTKARLEAIAGRYWSA